MNMVMIALRDGRRFQDLLKAIKAAGAHSATVLDNEGMDFLFFRGIRAGMEQSHGQGGGKTVLTMVPDALTESVVEAAERVMVGFNGMICAWQVGHMVSFQGEARSGELTRRFA
jgi:acyl-CoA reductase-like NAD-dependent aldehyde dehydrogenase